MIPRGTRRVPLAWLLRAVVCATLAGVVLTGIDAQQVLARVASLGLFAILPVLGLALAVLFFASLRWRIVLAALDEPRPFLLVWRLTMSGAFFNVALPSGGGDVARAWLTHRTGLSLGTAIRSVVVDRALALCGMLLVVLPLLPFTFELLPDAALRAGALMAAVAGVVIMLGLMTLDQIPLPPRITALRKRFIADFPAALRRVLSDFRLAPPALAAAVATHVLRVLLVPIIAMGLGISLGYGHCLLLVPLALLVASMPISLNGWGLREGVFAIVLPAAGVNSTDAVAISVCFGLAGLGAGLCGALAWMSLRSSHP